MEENLQKSLKPDREVMEQLLQYFESESGALDQLHNTDLIPIPGLNYVSYIVFDGVPILPPMMTPLRREEMLMYKRQAVLTETRLRARARQKLLHRVQHVMTEIEESQQRISNKQSNLNEPQSVLSAMDRNDRTSFSPSLDPENVPVAKPDSIGIKSSKVSQVDQCTGVSDSVNTNESSEKNLNPHQGEIMNNQTSQVEEKSPHINRTPETVKNMDVKNKASPKSPVNNVGLKQASNLVKSVDENSSSYLSVKLVDSDEALNDSIPTSSQVKADGENEFVKESSLSNSDINELDTNDVVHINDMASQSVHKDNISSSSDQKQCMANNVVQNQPSDISLKLENQPSEDTERYNTASQGVNVANDSLMVDSGVFSQRTPVSVDEVVSATLGDETDISTEDRDTASSIQSTPRDQRQNTLKEAGYDDEERESDDEIEAPSEEARLRPQSEMSIGLQLLRSKLQQAKEDQSEISAPEIMKTWPLSAQGAVVLNQNASADQGQVSKKRSSAAAWIQQSLAQIAPPPIDGKPGSLSTAVGTSSSGSLASSVSVASGNTLSSEEMNNTVIEKEEEQSCGSDGSDDQVQSPNDIVVRNHSLEGGTGEVGVPQGLEHTDSDKENKKPDLPLLSKVTFDVTPDVSPRKLPSNQDIAKNKREFEFGELADVSKAVKTEKEGNVASDNSNHGNKHGDVSVESPGPTKTPNLSNISFDDSDSEAGDEDLLQPPSSRAPAVMDPFVSSVATEDLVTHSTELAQYMHQGAEGVDKSMDTIHSDVQTLPHSEGNEQSSQTPENKPSSIERVRRNSYTLDHPSPALLAAQSKATAKEIVLQTSQHHHRQPELTGSMEDLKIRPVQRKLEYSNQGNHIGNQGDIPVTEDLPGDSDLAVIPVVDVDDEREEERHGKREHLQRYLQNLSEMPRVTATSDSEDVLSNGDTPPTDLQTGAQTLPNQPITPWMTSAPHQPMEGQLMSHSLPQPMREEFTSSSSLPQAMGNVVSSMPQFDTSNASDESMLQTQVAYFDQLQRALVQQQQQQLSLLIVEQEKQQQLFREQIIQQGRKLQQQRSRKPKGQPGVDSSQQCQAWLEQLQGVPNIVSSHQQQGVSNVLPSLTPGMPNLVSNQNNQGVAYDLHRGVQGASSTIQFVPKDNTAQDPEQGVPKEEAARTLPMDGFSGMNYEMPDFGRGSLPNRSGHLGSLNADGSSTESPPSVTTGTMDPRGGASTLPIMQQLQNNYQNNNKTGTGIPTALQLSGLPGYQGSILPSNPNQRPDSGLSDASTLTPSQLTELLSSMEGRPETVLSMLSSVLRPQSAPTPRQEYFTEQGSSSSPAGPAGVYYNQPFITDNSLRENSSTVNNSDAYHSPAVLRSKSKRSPASLPVEMVTGDNSMDNSLHSSERSVHFASPVHRTKYIEEGRMEDNMDTADISSSVMTGYQLSVHDQEIPSELEPCFVKLSAVAKGYLTRRLLRTEKVQELIKTIRDTAEFAIKFQQESPIKRGVYSNQDRKLQEQVIAQLTAVMYEIHDIFFDISTQERMTIIRIDRQVERERIFKAQSFQDKKKRLSTATLRSMDRKKKQQAAEEMLFGEPRPKSAPPPAMGKPKTPRMQRAEDIRALKPLHGNTSPRKPGEKSIRDTIRGSAPRKTSNQTMKPQTMKPVKTKSPSVTSTAVRKTSQPAKPTVRKIARPSKVTAATRPETRRVTAVKTTATLNSS